MKALPMKILFVTSNKVKLREFREFFRPLGIEVEQIDFDIPEIRYESVADVAREKARYAAEKTGTPVVAEDTGLYINALKGFPGACAKFVFNTLGLEGVLKLLSGAKDRSAEFRAAIAMAEPGKEPKVFLGIARGSIADAPQGAGYGYDPVFIPEGRTKSFAQEYDVKQGISHRADALKKFAEFLNIKYPKKQ